MSSVQPFSFDQPTNSIEALRRSISNRLVYQVGKDVRSATQRDWLFAILYAVRDRVMDSWREALDAAQDRELKRVYYLSMEFLTGRMLTNALMAVGIYDDTKTACAQLGADFDALLDLEADPGLGNGGLGRLAACFLDSIATVGLPGMGYGIRYDYGMFAQRIVNGQQVEEPDGWLVNGNPWEFMRPEFSYAVRFGGRLATENGRVKWIDTDDVIATAYDNAVPGYRADFSGNAAAVVGARQQRHQPGRLQQGRLHARDGGQERVRERLARALPRRQHRPRP